MSHEEHDLKAFDKYCGLRVQLAELHEISQNMKE